MDSKMTPCPKCERYREALEEAKELLECFVDDNPCRFDHHGYCQEHSVTMPCINERVKKWLAQQALKDGTGQEERR